MLSEHVHKRPDIHGSQLWANGDGSMEATHVILFVNVQVEETK
jgi:hypothetical protein